jgi:hypothetical protein
VAGADQAPRRIDPARAVQHLARGVVAQGHRLEAALLPRDPDQHPEIRGRGTVQRDRQPTGMLSARQPRGSGAAVCQSQVAGRQASALHTDSCRMEEHSIRQLGVGTACNTAPTPHTGSPQQVYSCKGCPPTKP